MEMWTLVSDVVILLSGCLLLGGLFSRIGQSPLVGYLLAGMVLGGPGSFHAIQSEHEIEAIAELGVALLLFSLGLEFSIGRLKKLGPVPLLGGLLQVVISLIVCAILALAAGFAGGEATAVGAMLALSSTAIVLRTLMEKSELETPYGGNSLAVLLIQDISVVPLAILISLLSGGDSAVSVAWNVGRIFLVSSLLIVGLYVLLNHVAFRTLGTLTLERNRELTTILSIVTGLGSAYAAFAAGISPALGAFVAGMFLGSSPFATQIRADISPLRIVLLTMFFGAAGMVADPIWILQNAPLVLGTTVVILLVKFAIIVTIFRSLGHMFSVAVASGICLAQIGEFAFVLGSVAMKNSVISEQTHNLIVSCTILSLFAGPFMVTYASQITNWLTQLIWRTSDPTLADATAYQHLPDVVIIGYGPAGQFAGKVVANSRLTATVIDLNRQGIRKATEIGFQGLVGDATQNEVLEHAHVSSAKVVVITIPSLKMAISVSDMVRAFAPHAHIVVRARYLRDINDLYAAGADIVFDDEQQIGASIGEHLTGWIAHHTQATDDKQMCKHTDLASGI